MAKKSSLLETLRALRGDIDLPPTPLDELPGADLLTPASRALSDSDRTRIIKAVASSVLPGDNIVQNGNLLNYIQAVTKHITSKSVENEQILLMAPQVNQAASIVIPSIVAPNDMRGGNIPIVSRCPELSEAQNQRVAAALETYFNTHLELATKVPLWIRDALYRTGARPLLVIPLSELDRQFNDKQNQIVPSTEAYESLVRVEAETSLFGIADSAPHLAALHEQGRAVNVDQLVAGVETYLGEELAQQEATATDKERKEGEDRRKAPYHRSATGLRGSLEALVSDITGAESLAILDNPDVIKVDQLARGKARQAVTSKLGTRYKDGLTLALGVPDKDEAPKGHPLFLELPTESVIPLFAPGCPSDHLGYFVLLDESGNPISAAESARSVDLAIPSMSQNNFQALFQAFGMTDFYASADTGRRLMAGIYQQIIESHIKTRLTNAGFHNVDIGADNNVFRCMLARYLQKRRTRLLFVPKDLLTYFCFEHSVNGVGQSKLETVKFILSLHITLLVCRMMTAVNNAVDRRQVEINLDPKMGGNMLEHLNTIQRELLRKSSVRFTMDPEEVQRNVVTKSYSFKFTGLPGLENYNVTSMPNERQGVQPDESLQELITTLLSLALDVPPSALNQLSENEFARSVTTNNILFSRKVVGWQAIVCKALTQFIQTYARFSEPLQEAIRTAIGKDEKGHAEAGTQSAVADDIVARVLLHLAVALPTPNIAPDKAQFENMEAFVTNVNALFDAVFPDDLVSGDAELQSALAGVKSLGKSDVIRKYLEDAGLTGIKLPDLLSMTPSMHLNLRQALMNVHAAVEMQKKALAPVAPEPAMPDAAAPPSPGGYPFQ